MPIHESYGSLRRFEVTLDTRDRGVIVDRKFCIDFTTNDNTKNLRIVTGPNDAVVSLDGDIKKPDVTAMTDGVRIKSTCFPADGVGRTVFVEGGFGVSHALPHEEGIAFNLSGRVKVEDIQHFGDLEGTAMSVMAAIERGRERRGRRE